MPNLGIQGLTLIEHKATDLEEAQRKITDYYKNDKKTITRNDHKTRNTRQSTIHRRTTPGNRKAKPKTKQECGDYNRRTTHDVHGEDEDWSGPYTDCSYHLRLDC
jgi:hypothetical protein